MEDLISQGSFAVLYKEYVGFAWRSLRRLGVSESQLDDAVQEVFIVVHRRLESFEGRSHFRSWLYGIVRKVASEFRRRRSLQAVELPEALEADPSCGPFETTAKQQGLSLLWALLDEMSPERREILVLKELEELSGPEIAELLDLDVENVYGRIRQARLQFSEAISRHHARIDTKQASYQLQQASIPSRQDRRRLAAALALLIAQLGSIATSDAAMLPVKAVVPRAPWFCKALAFGTCAAGALAGAMLAFPVVQHDTSAERELARPAQAISALESEVPAEIDAEPLTAAPSPSGGLAAAERAAFSPPKLTRVAELASSKASVVEPVLTVLADETTEQDPVSRLAEEADLLRGVMTALSKGQNDLAKELLDRHRDDFPAGQLAQEEQRLRKRLR